MADLKNELQKFLRITFPRYTPIFHNRNQDYVEYEQFFWWKEEIFRIKKETLSWTRNSITVFSGKDEQNIAVYTAIYEPKRWVLYYYFTEWGSRIGS